MSIATFVTFVTLVSVVALVSREYNKPDKGRYGISYENAREVIERPKRSDPHRATTRVAPTMDGPGKPLRSIVARRGSPPSATGRASLLNHVRKLQLFPYLCSRLDA